MKLLSIVEFERTELVSPDLLRMVFIEVVVCWEFMDLLRVKEESPAAKRGKVRFGTCLINIWPTKMANKKKTRTPTQP